VSNAFAIDATPSGPILLSSKFNFVSVTFVSNECAIDAAPSGPILLSLKFDCVCYIYTHVYLILSSIHNPNIIQFFYNIDSLCNNLYYVYYVTTIYIFALCLNMKICIVVLKFKLYQNIEIF
jgi:hypothetical protein